jgi:23S rRNA pseudoU1915 N3-methylase RlmH
MKVTVVTRGEEGFHKRSFRERCAVLKLGCLSMTHTLHHFALWAKLYAKAIRQAFHELKALRAA